MRHLSVLSVVLILMSILVGCGGESQPGCQGWVPPAYKKSVGEPAPDFTLATAADKNKTVTLSEATKEHPVLLTFWASWCPACVEEIPALNEWNKKYVSTGLQIFGINVQETREHVLEFQKTHPMSYPVLLDEDGHVADKFGLVGLPAAVILAKGGEIIYYGFGLPDNPDEVMKEMKREPAR